MPSVLSGIFRKTWTLGDLLGIDQGRQGRAGGCYVDLEQVYHDVRKETILEKFKRFFTRNSDLMNVYYVTFKFQVVSDTGRTHTVIIRTQPDWNMTEYTQNVVQIYCDCPDFMYRSAWILNQHGALFRSAAVDVELGPAPTTAPKGKSKTSTLCKHAYAALQYLIQNYSGLMKNM